MLKELCNHNWAVVTSASASYEYCVLCGKTKAQAMFRTGIGGGKAKMTVRDKDGNIKEEGQ